MSKDHFAFETDPVSTFTLMPCWQDQMYFGRYFDLSIWIQAWFAFETTAQNVTMIKGNLFLLKDKIRTTQQSLLLPKCPPQAFYMQCKHKKEHFCINNSKIDNHETIFQEKNGQQKMTYGFIVNIVQNTITF